MADVAPRYPALLQPPLGLLRFGGANHPDEDPFAPVLTALGQGVTGVVVDVHLTADGDPVIHPAPTLRIGLRRRALDSLSTTQVPTQVPRLADLYERCGNELDLAVHLTDDAAVAVVVGLAADAGGHASERLWLCSANWCQAASWRVAAGDARLVDSTRLRRVDEGPERRAANLAKAGVDAVQLHESDWSAGLCALFHRFNRLALAGPAPQVHQLDALLAMGLDAVSSEHADRLDEARAGF
ncbi:MAG: hypothetical protein M3535_08645 [Actinomycetota bacterium]|nr:hypothetical protein [Actinomycetota bacterium]